MGRRILGVSKLHISRPAPTKTSKEEHTVKMYCIFHETTNKLSVYNTFLLKIWTVVHFPIYACSVNKSTSLYRVEDAVMQQIFTLQKHKIGKTQGHQRMGKNVECLINPID